MWTNQRVRLVQSGLFSITLVLLSLSHTGALVAEVTGLPFLIAVVLGVFGALAYGVSQTAVPVTGPPT